ncbi:MAG: hypothetical protein KFW21_03790 [Spirochaetota bacterium]|nr:hypothetical protein [Spirochaetota bacterium]
MPSLTIKRYQYVLIVLTFFIFIYWFIQGYYTTFWIDPMKEMIGNVTQLRFPNTLWNHTIKNQNHINYLMREWHTARWTADIIPYISYQTIGRLYHFSTKDPVTAIYISQGLYVALYFTFLAWIIALYTKIALKISTYSYHFLYILFISGISPFMITTISLDKNISIVSHYIWPMTLMLIALYPYWKAFFNNIWDEKYISTLLSQSIWYTIILLTAFSSNGITILYFYIQAIIGLYLFIAHPQKNILEKIKYFLLSPPSYVKVLYCGGIFCVIAILSERFYGINIKYNAGLGHFPSFSENLKSSISLLIPYHFIFFIYYSYYTFISFLSKLYKKDLYHNISKFIIITIFSHFSITMCTLLIGVMRSAIYAYLDPMKILTLLNGLLILSQLLINFKSPLLYAIILISTFSNYLEFIPRYPSIQKHLQEYQWYQDLYYQNKTRTNKQNIIVSSSYLYSEEILEVIQEFARSTEIIDPEVTLSLEEEK